MSTFYSPATWKDCRIGEDAAKESNIDNPFEAKCLYVVGSIRHLLLAANKLYPMSVDDADHRLPACILGFNALELLGRCLRGDTEHRNDYDKRIKKALRYIAYLSGSKTGELKIDKGHSYGIPSNYLVKVRNFTAHGFYGSDAKLHIEGLLVAWLLGAIADAIQRYYSELKVGNNYEGMLQATIQPLYVENRPTRITAVYEHINKGLDISQPGEPIKIWNWAKDYDDVRKMNKWLSPSWPYIRRISETKSTLHIPV